jgi:type III secretion protein R
MNPLPVLAAASAARVSSVDHLSGLASRPVLLLIAVAALSLLPFIALLMTSFVKIAVVLSILRSALGSAQIPPSQIITGLALIMTIYVMAPTGERMFAAIEPELARGSSAEILSGQGLEALGVAADKAKEPVREFLLKHGSARDRSVFHALALRMRTGAERVGITERDFLVLVPAFLASELRRAFEIGFLIFIPFLVVDLVISNLLLALGMHMLSPTAISLPFKLLLFVLADGWQLLLRGLVETYV